jgi:hypothetical protein
MRESSKNIVMLLDALRARLDDFCQESETEFKNNLNSFKLSNFQIEKETLGKNLMN